MGLKKRDSPRFLTLYRLYVIRKYKYGPTSVISSEKQQRLRQVLLCLLQLELVPHLLQLFLHPQRGVNLQGLGFHASPMIIHAYNEKKNPHQKGCHLVLSFSYLSNNSGHLLVKTIKTAITFDEEIKNVMYMIIEFVNQFYPIWTDSTDSHKYISDYLIFFLGTNFTYLQT